MIMAIVWAINGFHASTKEIIFSFQRIDNKVRDGSSKCHLVLRDT
jgi:hypothetical protein